VGPNGEILRQKKLILTPFVLGGGDRAQAYRRDAPVTKKTGCVGKGKKGGPSLTESPFG